MASDLRKSKLGFTNPLIPNSDDISYDPYDLQDPITAQQIIFSKEDVFKRRNVFKGMSEFIGVVISKSVPLGQTGIFSGLANIFQIGAGNDNNIMKLKVHIPELHACLGNPCDIGNYERVNTNAEKLAIAESIIEKHPYVLVKVKEDQLGKAPQFGDIIKIKFSKGPSGGSQQDAELVDILSSGQNLSINSYCTDSLFESFKNGTSTTMSDYPDTDANGVGQVLGQGVEDFAEDFALAYPFEMNAAVTSKISTYRVVNGNARSHQGVDFGTPIGTRILAAGDGIVDTAKESDGLAGKYITIKHDNNGNLIYTRYMHLSSFGVKQGDVVIRGQFIGTSGTAGTGPHLHFEVRRDLSAGGETTIKPGEENTAEGKRKLANFNYSVIDPLIALTLPGIEDNSASSNYSTSTQTNAETSGQSESIPEEDSFKQSYDEAEEA